MRWVDIKQISLPPGWQERADNALSQLRIEIMNAELKAQQNQTDIATARKKAITDGLEQQSRTKIWRDLAPELAKLHNGKCWYSESKNPGCDKNVDHFRPKNQVKEDPTHEGYWWLAFDWMNYRYSCQWCNQRRNDIANKTDGGKWDYFPLSNNSFRARQENDNLILEDIELLDPIDPEDWKLLTFLPTGLPTPAKQPGTNEYNRAKNSIQIYHLHCLELVRDRKELAIKIRSLVENMEIIQPKIIDLEIRKIYKNLQMELLRYIHPHSEYTAAALAYAKSEVYKMEGGHQKKRDWLEAILHSNP